MFNIFRRDTRTNLLDDADIRGILGNYRDITDRKSAETALRDSEEKFRRIVENGEPIVFMTDTAGKFVLSEGRSLSALGLRPGEVVGGSAYEIYRDFPAVVQGIKTALAGRVHRDVVEVGDVSFDIFYSPCMDEKGSVSAAVGMAMDITDRKRGEEEREHLEEQLRQAQKMEAIGQLAGGVAHDFNNLLQIIHGYTDLALGELTEDDPIRPMLDESIRASERARDLVRQLLAFSRRQTMNPKIIDLDVVIDGVTKMLRRIIREDVDLLMEVSSSPTKVRADSGQIEQILMNLCVNARDAMPQGGIITI